MHSALILPVLSVPRCLYALLYLSKLITDDRTFTTLLAPPSWAPNSLLATSPGVSCYSTQHTSQSLTSQLGQTQLIARKFIFAFLKRKSLSFTFSLVEGIKTLIGIICQHIKVRCLIHVACIQKYQKYHWLQKHHWLQKLIQINENNQLIVEIINSTKSCELCRSWILHC